MITITVGLGTRHQWPNGKPISTETLRDGRRRHTMEDGRVLTVDQPTYRLDYASTWVGSRPGDTYSVDIAVIGLSTVPGFFEAWNFQVDEIRHYAFRKTAVITHLVTGETFTGEEMRAAMGGPQDPEGTTG